MSSCLSWLLWSLFFESKSNQLSIDFVVVVVSIVVYSVVLHCVVELFVDDDDDDISIFCCIHLSYALINAFEIVNAIDLAIFVLSVINAWHSWQLLSFVATNAIIRSYVESTKQYDILNNFYKEKMRKENR